jgi:hypothetical protein
MSLDNLRQIREQIKTILAGVPGIGVVHDYDRLTTDYTKFLKRFLDEDSRINGCQFARTRREQRFVNGQEVIHIISIRRIMAVQDAEATGIIFDDHIEDLAGLFEANDSLNDSCQSTCPDWGEMTGLSGLQVDLVEHRTFGGVLCHYAECRLAAVES